MKPEDFLIDATTPAGDVPKPDLREYMTARHIVSVMDSDYGTAGGGEADDADGINAADTALVGYGIVWFPRVIGGYYVGSSLVMHNNGTTWMGEGSGDYQAGGSVIVKTDVDDLDMVTITDNHCAVIKGIAFVNEADDPTGTGILITNSQNGRLDDVCVRGFDTGVKFVSGASAPHSCFGWSILDSEIISHVSYAVDAQANTNTLTIWHTTLGAEEVALRWKDSISLTVDSTSNIETAGNVGIEIDATTQLDANATINCHFEFGGAAPTNGCIRIGNTAKMWGVRVSCAFVGSGLITVNPLNGSSFTWSGCSIHGSQAAGDVLIGTTGSISDVSGVASTVANNVNSTGQAAIHSFVQKNAANEWMEFARIQMSATSVVDGNEQSSMKFLLRTNGAFQDAASLFWDSNGVLCLQVEGYIRVKDGVTAPSDATGYMSQYVDTSDGDLKAKFSGGTTKVISADT